MTRKTITYIDLDGNEVTETFMFNLTATECTEKNMTTPGGYIEMLNRIINTKDAPALYNTFKEFILDAYGMKSPDGKRFIKSAQLSEEFTQSPAYDILMTELLSDADYAGKFINSILPEPPKDSQPSNVAKTM